MHNWGDINIDALKINTNDHVETFLKSTLEQYFMPTITLPTRIVETSISMTDHIIINRHVLKNSKDIVSGNI